jgi:hypothetical protein
MSKLGRHRFKVPRDPKPDTRAISMRRLESAKQTFLEKWGSTMRKHKREGDEGDFSGSVQRLKSSNLSIMAPPIGDGT